VERNRAARVAKRSRYRTGRQDHPSAAQTKGVQFSRAVGDVGLRQAPHLAVDAFEFGTMLTGLPAGAVRHCLISPECRPS
jgi:hypothetical protein